MQIMNRWFHYAGMAMILTIAVPAFSESAPVYDVDSVQQAFDNGGDANQDLPPPPAPGQENAYVPGQSHASHNVQAPPLTPEQRIRRMEQQISNLQNNDAATRADALQNQVQALRGQVEELTHQLQQLQNQQKVMYTDLDKRMSQQLAMNSKTSAPDEAASIEATPKPTKASRKLASSAKVADTSVTAGAAVSAKPLAAAQPDVAEEQQIYQTAYNLIKAKKYEEAVTALQKMLQKYPSGQFASNAHYWLGELYGLLGKSDQALTEFNAVVKTYPSSQRVSDAQLKVGLIFASQSKWVDAKSAFKKVISHYPGTASARLASEQLKQIKQAGH